MSPHRVSGVRAAVAAAVAVFALAGLAGCGKQGPLERPAPLFGSARAQWEAERAQEAADDAQRAAQRPGGTTTDSTAGSGPVSRRDEVLDPNQRLTPASQDPIPGASNLRGRPAATTP